MSTNGFDYDVIVIGSGFGGGVAEMRATERAIALEGWRPADVSVVLANKGEPICGHRLWVQPTQTGGAAEARAHWGTS